MARALVAMAASRLPRQGRYDRVDVGVRGCHAGKGGLVSQRVVQTYMLTPHFAGIIKSFRK
eukprot:4075798-Heterocapsa_arctica.AAC.1